MLFAFRTHWWRKIQYLGLNKQCGKKDSEVSQFLKDIFGLSLLPPVKVSDCFAFEFISNLTNDRRVEQCWVYVPENCIAADSTFHPSVWSECSASSFGTTKTCESFDAHFKALLWSAYPNILFLHLHCQKYRMRPTWKWEASIQEGLKNQKQ